MMYQDEVSQTRTKANTVSHTDSASEREHATAEGVKDSVHVQEAVQPVGHRKLLHRGQNILAGNIRANLS